MEFLNLEDKDEEQIIFDVFGLNSLQKSLFDEMRNTKLTVKELASEVDRNRSTVQRALQDMLDKDLILREGKTDKTVYYVYTTLPMSELREVTRDTLEQWHEKVEKRLS
ncbi:MAG: putative transcriptional regulator [Candidatus Nanohaloarchaea archaeon]|jgi:predicted transcriptional regulator